MGEPATPLPLMSNYILSLHAGHNASAAIGDASGLQYAIQEERLTGEKNYWGFPRQAIRSCLDQVGASPSDVGTIAIGSHQVIARYHTRQDVLKAYQRQETLVGKLRQRLAMPLLLTLKPDWGQSGLHERLDKMGLAGAPVVHYDHHLSHAATAYYGLRNNHDEECLIVTCDGMGDNICATIHVARRGDFTEVARTHWDNSLGAIYSWVTYAMGFVPLEHEYKLMGMAPYAPEKAARETAEIFHAYLGLDEDGLRFKRKVLGRTNDLSERLFSDLRGKRFDYICAGLQLFTETILTQWIQNAVRKTGVRRVLGAGGVFMNVKANQQIAALDEVESFEAFPSCGDETLPLGALWLELAKQQGAESVPSLKHFYLGDDLDADATRSAVESSGLSWEKPDDMASAVVALLSQGKPVARCAGRMEFGARALGNRSILADPRNQDVVRIINQMVKKRDFWMPFAPMMMAEHHEEYVQNPKGLRSPYMMMTFDTRENFRDLIAAVHNADLTCRAQLLTSDQNPEMHSILSKWRETTGSAVILNTSFNLHGFPIVRTAKEAIDVVQASGLEHLQVGEYLVHKT
ncbi:MAG: carbamoyltransferase C-terminal domain-containing protein [Myxococcota bacterium]